MRSCVNPGKPGIFSAARCESFDLVIFLLGSPDVSLGVAGNRGQPALAAGVATVGQGMDSYANLRNQLES